MNEEPKKFAGLISVGGLTDLNKVLDAFNAASEQAKAKSLCAIGHRIECEDGFMFASHGGNLASTAHPLVANYLVECANSVPLLVKLLDEAAAEIRRLSAAK